MIRVGIATALVAGVAFAPELALAATDEHASHGPNYWLLGMHVLNTVILGTLLVRFAGPALNSFLRDRSDGIRDRIADAEGKLAEATREIQELRARLGEVSDTRDRLTREARSQGESEKQRIVERAEHSAERIREEARRVADQEIARARQALQAEAAQLATELAGDLLRERMTPDDHARLVGEFTDRVGRAN